MASNGSDGLEKPAEIVRPEIGTMATFACVTLPAQFITPPPPSCIGQQSNNNNDSDCGSSTSTNEGEMKAHDSSDEGSHGIQESQPSTPPELSTTPPPNSLSPESTASFKAESPSTAAGSPSGDDGSPTESGSDESHYPPGTIILRSRKKSSKEEEALWKAKIGFDEVPNAIVRKNKESSLYIHLYDKDNIRFVGADGVVVGTLKGPGTARYSKNTTGPNLPLRLELEENQQCHQFLDERSFAQGSVRHIVLSPAKPDTEKTPRKLNVPLLMGSRQLMEAMNMGNGKRNVQGNGESSSSSRDHPSSSRQITQNHRHHANGNHGDQVNGNVKEARQENHDNQGEEAQVAPAIQEEAGNHQVVVANGNQDAVVVNGNAVVQEESHGNQEEQPLDNGQRGYQGGNNFGQGRGRRHHHARFRNNGNREGLARGGDRQQNNNYQPADNQARGRNENGYIARGGHRGYVARQQNGGYNRQPYNNHNQREQAPVEQEQQQGQQNGGALVLRHNQNGNENGQIHNRQGSSSQDWLADRALALVPAQQQNIRNQLAQEGGVCEAVVIDANEAVDAVQNMIARNQEIDIEDIQRAQQTWNSNKITKFVKESFWVPPIQYHPQGYLNPTVGCPVGVTMETIDRAFALLAKMRCDPYNAYTTSVQLDWYWNKPSVDDFTLEMENGMYPRVDQNELCFQVNLFVDVERAKEGRPLLGAGDRSITLHNGKCSSLMTYAGMKPFTIYYVTIRTSIEKFNIYDDSKILVLRTLPAPPESPSLSYWETDENSVMISWFPPLDNGGLVTHYQLYMYENECCYGRFIRTSTSTVHIERLKPQTMYKIALTAWNALGESVTPSHFEIFTKANQSSNKIRGIKVHSVSHRSLRVQWRRDPNSQYAIKLQNFATNAIEVVNHRSDTNHAMISYLRPDTEYGVVVIQSNNTDASVSEWMSARTRPHRDQVPREQPLFPLNFDHPPPNFDRPPPNLERAPPLPVLVDFVDNCAMMGWRGYGPGQEFQSFVVEGSRYESPNDFEQIYHGRELSMVIRDHNIYYIRVYVIQRRSQRTLPTEPVIVPRNYKQFKPHTVDNVSIWQNSIDGLLVKWSPPDLSYLGLPECAALVYQTHRTDIDDSPIFFFNVPECFLTLTPYEQNVRFRIRASVYIQGVLVDGDWCSDVSYALPPLIAPGPVHNLAYYENTSHIAWSYSESPPDLCFEVTVTRVSDAVVVMQEITEEMVIQARNLSAGHLYRVKVLPVSTAGRGLSPVVLDFSCPPNSFVDPAMMAEIQAQKEQEQMALPPIEQAPRALPPVEQPQQLVQEDPVEEPIPVPQQVQEIVEEPVEQEQEPEQEPAPIKDVRNPEKAGGSSVASSRDNEEEAETEATTETDNAESTAETKPGEKPIKESKAKITKEPKAPKVKVAKPKKQKRNSVEKTIVQYPVELPVVQAEPDEPEQMDDDEEFLPKIPSVKCDPGHNNLALFWAPDPNTSIHYTLLRFMEDGEFHSVNDGRKSFVKLRPLEENTEFRFILRLTNKETGAVTQSKEFVYHTTLENPPQVKEAPTTSLVPGQRFLYKIEWEHTLKKTKTPGMFYRFQTHDRIVANSGWKTVYDGPNPTCLLNTEEFPNGLHIRVMAVRTLKNGEELRCSPSKSYLMENIPPPIVEVDVNRRAAMMAALNRFGPGTIVVLVFLVLVACCTNHATGWASSILDASPFFRSNATSTLDVPKSSDSV